MASACRDGLQCCNDRHGMGLARELRLASCPSRRPDMVLAGGGVLPPAVRSAAALP